jgi:hypothetical protein
LFALCLLSRRELLLLLFVIRRICCCCCCCSCRCRCSFLVVVLERSEESCICLCRNKSGLSSAVVISIPEQSRAICHLCPSPSETEDFVQVETRRYAKTCQVQKPSSQTKSTTYTWHKSLPKPLYLIQIKRRAPAKPGLFSLTP